MPSLDDTNPYLAVAVIAFLEAVGAPMPSAPLLVAAGALAATRDVSVALMIVAAAAGAFLADAGWYEVGRKRGAGLVKLYCTVSLGSAQCGTTTERFFRRMGPRALLVSKFVPGLAAMAAPMAGMIGVRRRQFWSLDAAGAVLWSATLLGLGYLAGPSVIDVLSPHAERLGSVLTWGIIAAVAILFAVRLWKRLRFGPAHELIAPTPAVKKDADGARESQAA